MQKRHLINTRFIVCIILCIISVIGYTVESQKVNKCSSAFQPLASAVEQYSKIMRDTKYEIPTGYIDPVELMHNMRDRMSREEPQVVLAVISDTKEASNTREVTLDLLAEVLFAEKQVRQQYTNKEVIKILTPIAFDRESSHRMRGPAISILCLLYSEINVPHVHSFFLHKLRNILFDKNESDHIKRQIIYGLKIFQDPMITRIMEDIVINERESDTLQIDAMYILAESKTVDPEIINVLINRLLEMQSSKLKRLSSRMNMIRAIVDTLYAISSIHTSYKPAVEELINRFFFGMYRASPAPTILRANAIPPLNWSLDSSYVYSTPRSFFSIITQGPFMDTATFFKRIRNRTFLNLEYSHNFSMVHILYFLFLNKKEDPTLRIRVLQRLYLEGHPLLPYLLAGMVVDTREMDWVKFATLIMIEAPGLEGMLPSSKYFQNFLDMQTMAELRESQAPDGQSNISVGVQNRINGRTEESDFQEVLKILLKRLRSEKSNDPMRQEFLRAVSQPELVEQKLSDFISDSKNEDSIMKGVMVYALSEWSMWDNIRLAGTAVSRGLVDYNVRLMAIKKLVDNLVELKKSSSQDVDTSIVDHLVKIFTDPLEDPSMRELAAEALFQIQPSNQPIQQRIITALSNEKDVVVQDVIHYFQWIKNLPVTLQLSDNVRKIK